MTLTKVQIVEAIQNKIGFPRNKSYEILESFLEVIKST
ncbi:MAG: integration host factor subunit alpha, partial [Deltaproteobacteria bacterium]|nr:integration host factor subunit alpha [Deltaproteobacteria bacterium]